MIKLTIGMAVFDEYDGPVFTIQALRMYQDLQDCEILLVDNKPDSPVSADLKQYCVNVGARYIAAPEVFGTAAPRNRIFAEAQGDAVLCMDSHVLLWGGAIKKLKEWYASNSLSMDLVTGPLIYDHSGTMSTHFVHQWREMMLGTWSQAWEACPGGTKFSVEDENGRAKYISLDKDFVQLTSSASCGIDLPKVPYAGHERHLLKMGARMLGSRDTDQFTIPGMGLGLFSCRKSAWLGFNPLFQGFGGEEMYIHEKFRQAGRNNYCLGFLKWWHRFGRPGGTKYPNTVWDRARNYVLGHRELGWNTDDVYEHFVKGNKMTQEEWDLLMANPEAPRPTGEQFRAAGLVGSAPPDMDTIYETISSTKRDLDQHMPYLRSLASKCETVTEFSKRRESFIAFASGRPKKFVSYNVEANDPMVRQMVELGKDFITVEQKISDDVEIIDATELLFIDSHKHTHAQITKEMEKFMPRVSRFAVFHDSISYAGKGEDGSEGGIMTAIREYVESHPGTFIYYHTSKQYGLTVIGIRPEDQPAAPLQPWPIGYGPGTELKAILESIGVSATTGCDCGPKAEQMDRWGIEGCKRRENFETIVNWMRDGQDRWRWTDKMKAAAKAAQTGLALQINWFDPFPDLVSLSIERAEAKEKAKKDASNRGPN
jgi:hypothetical protein